MDNLEFIFSQHEWEILNEIAENENIDEDALNSMIIEIIKYVGHNQSQIIVNHSALVKNMDFEKTNTFFFASYVISNKKNLISNSFKQLMDNPESVDSWAMKQCISTLIKFYTPLFSKNRKDKIKKWAKKELPFKDSELDVLKLGDDVFHNNKILDDVFEMCFSNTVVSFKEITETILSIYPKSKKSEALMLIGYIYGKMSSTFSASQFLNERLESILEK